MYALLYKMFLYAQHIVCKILDRLEVTKLQKD